MTGDWPTAGAAILTGETYHGRRGGPANAFRYGVDYLLWRLRPAASAKAWPLRRGRFGLLGLSDRDHGRGEGRMLDWALAHARAQGLPEDAMAEVWLLTQPRTLGYVFNPVSFWFFRDAEHRTRAVLAEVNNTFGDRHSYLCAHADWRPLADGDTLQAAKVFHVSPFQQVAGDYRFRFRLRDPSRLSIVIDHRRAGHGVVATLKGRLAPVTARGLLAMMARHPLGALRVSLLIYWQALKLKWKGASYRTRPTPPIEEVSR